jgi:hypothetical protein
MNTLSWLHLSDWHQKGAEFDRAAVRDALLDDLCRRAELQEGLEQLDFIIFSGDLAFSGTPEEYEGAAKEFLLPILEVTQVPRDRLFLVPGNHDLYRPTLKLIAPMRQLFSDRRTMHVALLQERGIVLQPMRAYAQFCKTFFGDYAAPEAAYSYLKTFEVRGIRVAVIGMNSAWMCGQRVENSDVDDYGSLIIGEPQFHDFLRSPEVKGSHLRIGVLHHPFAWLSDLERRSFVERSLTRGLHFILRGHEHESDITIPQVTHGDCAIISAGAAYDRREYPNGYNFVHLDLDSGEGAIYLRRYDIDRGFHRDAVVTGDESPGVQAFILPKQLGKMSTRYVKAMPSPVAVDLVTDYRSPDVLAALDLYDDRIPEGERFEATDIMRWLREDQEQRELGIAADAPRDFLLVAKARGQVCGFALLHYYPIVQFAFIAYLVADRGVQGGNGSISERLADRVSWLLGNDTQLRNSKGFLLEVDDPSRAESENDRTERLARIRLFCMLAEREGYALRALDFDYRQPQLKIPVEKEFGKELPMLLMYAPKRASSDGCLSKSDAENLLAFIYKRLYPESFSAIAEENDAYRRYLEDLYQAQTALLPDRIASLSFAQIRARSGSAR